MYDNPLDHDRRRETEIDALLAQGKIEQAKRTAILIRGRPNQARVDAKIAERAARNNNMTHN